jgi:hypothetical protein
MSEPSEKRRAYHHARYVKNRDKILKQNRAWCLANRDKIRRHARRSHLKFYFGITIEQYEKLLIKQNGRCAICQGTNGRLRLAVDHNHKTNEVRGLLCGPCNRALGLLKDSSKLLAQAIIYLDNDPSKE